MILLIWSSDRAQDCARAIENAFQRPVRVVSNLQQACEHLQNEEYSAVLIDQWISEAEPGQADYLFHHLGTAAPVFVNFGISGIERIVRELRAAFNRRGRETMLARHNARIALRNELKDDVTALLLSCGIALSDVELNEAAIARVKKIEETALRIKEKLTVSEEESSPQQTPADSAKALAASG
ncbi:MAG TPA: hypothetical protein VGU90_05480 [Terriglobales bacterium]|nr:hypothetical protein [Terriglobales bacterium]